MYTTETRGFTRPSPALIAARIKAAGRTADERKAEAARKAARLAAADRYAESLIRDLTGAGAVKIGMKVCTESGKYRSLLVLSDYADEDGQALLRILIASTYGEDAEVWGVRADGTYCEEVY